MIRPLALAALLGLAPAVSATVTTGAGFAHHTVPAAPAGAFPGGLDALPNGHVAVFDGAAIVELDPATGAVVQTLYTPPGFVFGSFVKTDPTGSFLLFGESSAGTITRVPLDGTAPSVVATIAFNFDCTFDAVGAPYVSASPSFVTTQVFRLSLATGGSDLILDIGGPSGPIAFDARNALYYAEASGAFPAPVGQQTIFRFTAGQVASATGPGSLAAVDGTPFVSGVTSIADLVFDDEGDLLASDSADGTIREYDEGGNVKHHVASEAPFNAITTLAFRGDGGGPAPFDAFQPASGGTLYALSTDFFSFNDLNVVTPARPTLGTTPASPIPVGPLTLDITGGPANGAVFLLVTTQTLPSEIVVHAGTTPLLVGVDVGTLLGGALLPLDTSGGLSLAASHHGAPTSVAVQGLVHDGGAFVGTTNATTVVLQ